MIPDSHSLHQPVLMNEFLQMMSPVIEAHDGKTLRYFDGTFGRGGHLKALLERHSNINALAFDQDPEAIEYGQKNFSTWLDQGRLELFQGNFSQFDVERWGHFDLMLLDLGVSSPQLDQGHRGFSFYHEGPLDMRMDNSQGITAAEIINAYSEDELNALFQELGEISRPYRVTRAIVHDRKEKPFLNTRDLAGLIERVEGWHRKGHHPATQYFLALRLSVNAELDVVENSLEKLVHGLKSKGRLAVLTFHSLEDRIVKNKFKEFAEETKDWGSAVNKKVIQAPWSEASENPRARSAKLRVFERK
ncbi:MAG: 16S rRNA (cytosine(1402)-N(4))-methyltransferase [Bdellovibrio sp. CG10_big_fil_rev_8_21_14_0_10_47_8]|nr:MAG: 16S rRNA (cytosine(1402)-N(4))-methyltransferase [Bdellovibrio sp. CG10_big_fil_rev_8_21_14_0_10_47_8]